MTAHLVDLLTPQQAQARRAALVDLLVDTVEGGASVNFIWPMTRTKAETWWEGALASHARGERLIFTAEAEGRLDGTVQLILAPQENQAFRADLAKLLVHRRARRQGLGAALMRAAEERSAPDRAHAVDPGYRDRQRRRTALHPARLDEVRRGSGLCDEGRQPLTRCRKLLL